MRDVLLTFPLPLQSRYVKLIVDGEMACPSCYFKKANEEADENGLEPASRFNAGHLSQPSLETLRKVRPLSPPS